MKTFDALTRLADRHLMLRGLATGAAALALVAGSSVSLAQDGEDYEYEPGYGTHEEEWYDPSDWFDDEPYSDDDNDIDYEEQDWDYQYDYERDDGYTGTYDYDYDAYHSGYMDGYEDDDFGMDQQLEGDSEYSTTYTDGYYDGYYDQEQGYEADPYYYIWIVDSTSQGRQSDNERQRDQNRERGDRMKNKMSDSAQRQQDRNRDGTQRDRRQQQRHVNETRADRDRARDQMAQMERMRGTLTQSEFMKKNVDGQQMLIAKVTFEDGKSTYLHLGPNMTEERFPVDDDEKATFVGKKQKVNIDGQQRDVLVTYRIIDDGERINLRGPDRQQMEQRNRQMERQNRDRMGGNDRNRDQREDRDRRYPRNR